MRILPHDLVGEGVDERKAICDIYCQDSQGNYFIVEMQKAKQNFFKDRTIFYTMPHRFLFADEQANVSIEFLKEL